MQNRNLDFRAYFLGKLPAEESAAIELDIISNPHLEMKLHSAESELIEDYLDEMLAPDEKELFDKNFLITKERQKRLDFLKLLKNHDSSAVYPKKIQNLATDEKPDLFNFLKNLFSLKFGAVPILTALLILVSTIGSVWLIFYFNGGQSEIAHLEKAVNEKNQKDFTDFSDYKNYPNLSLTPGNLRSSGEKNSLSQNNLTGDVFFRLMLPVETNADKSYTAKINKNGKSALTLKEIRTYRNDAGREIRLLLPAGVLTKGEYQIELAEENSDAENGKISYVFAIN